jgi:uncharacterized protein YjeT (DUF2065 family)
MGLDPGFWARLGEFVVAVVSHWGGWLGILLMVEPTVELFLPDDFRSWLTDTARFPEWRKRAFRIAGVIVLAIGFFQVWNDQYKSRLEAERRLAATTPSAQLQAELDAVRWNPLSDPQMMDLRERLRVIGSQKIELACASVNCRELTDSLATAFRGAGWTVGIHHGGGLGVDGVLGISIDPNDQLTQSIKAAIDGATTLTANLTATRREDFGNGPVWLVVGTKPF